MKYTNLISFAFLFLLIGCGLFRQQPVNTLYTFSLDSKTYQIAGFHNGDGESVNYLVEKEDDRVIFRAIDEYQNGVLDRVVSGSISLREANRIYQTGIRMAMESDQFREVERERTFETETDEHRLVIASFKTGENQFQNRFLIYDLNWDLLGIYWDSDSDGVIDRQEQGDIEPDRVQALYNIALQNAADRQRIEERDGNQTIITIAESEHLKDIPQKPKISQ